MLKRIMIVAAFLMAAAPFAAQAQCQKEGLAESIVDQPDVHHVFLVHLESYLVDAEDEFLSDTPVLDINLSPDEDGAVFDYASLPTDVTCPHSLKGDKGDAVEEMIAIQAVENLLASFVLYPGANYERLVTGMGINNLLLREVGLIKSGKKPVTVYSDEDGFEEVSRAIRAYYPYPWSEVVHIDKR